MKKAGIYDPYLDTLGGGERYCLTLAEFLLNSGWEVDLFWEKEDLKEKIGERFQISLKRVNFVYIPKKLLKKVEIHRKYDLLFWLSDGSVPFMFAKKNILHFQIPFKNVGGKSFLNKFKLKLIDEIICNSQFTKEVIDGEFGIKSIVIYPPVDVNKFKSGKKENIILSVGRFSRLMQEKGQEILINCFKKITQEGLRGWKFILAGGSEVGGSDLVERLRLLAKGYPIEIFENISFRQLVDLCSKAKIFWAANGYGIDEDKNPEKMEHFGISVVEAMSAGAVPLLIKKGGFREIIEDGKSGFFWESTDELIGKTLQLSGKSLEKIARQARQRSLHFAKEKFYERISKIIS